MRDDPFFRDTPRTTLDLDGEEIEYPILYYDTRYVLCFFAAKTAGVGKLLPHPCLKPVEIFPGLTWLAIAAFEYRDTSIGPYNELAIAFPVRLGQRSPLPGFSAASMLLRSAFSAYIHHLPVTTEIARKVGVFFHGYPKFLANITFTDLGEELLVDLHERNEMILTLRAKKVSTKQSRSFRFATYAYRDKAITRSIADGLAPHAGIKAGSFATLEIGEHPKGKEIAGLAPGRVARIGLYAEGSMVKLNLPDRRWQGDTLELLQ